MFFGVVRFHGWLLRVKLLKKFRHKYLCEMSGFGGRSVASSGHALYGHVAVALGSKGWRIMSLFLLSLLVMILKPNATQCSLESCLDVI